MNSIHISSTGSAERRRESADDVSLPTRKRDSASRGVDFYPCGRTCLKKVTADGFPAFCATGREGKLLPCGVKSRNSQQVDSEMPQREERNISMKKIHRVQPPVGNRNAHSSLSIWHRRCSRVLRTRERRGSRLLMRNLRRSDDNQQNVPTIP